jgi:hypothetical protein
MNTPTTRTAIGLTAGLVALLALAGCGPDQAAPPTTVVVNTPPADGGLAVLLTVVVVLGVLAVVLAAGMVCAWSHERRSRRDAEDLVQAVTGRPVGHVRAALATHPTATPNPPAQPQLRLSPPPAAVERWHE